MAPKPRVDIMLAYPFEAKRLAKWKPPYIVQPKLDGDRCRVPFGFGLSSLLSSTGELITGVPHISDTFDYIARYCGGSLELDGELYCHGMDQAKINGIVKRKYLDNLHPEFEKIKFYMFDLINEEFQLKRLEHLQIIYDNIKSSGVVELVPYELAYSYDEVIAAFNKYVDMGYEGIIVRKVDAYYKRSRSIYMMKFKVKKKDYYRIVGVNEAISEGGLGLAMLGAFVCEDTMGSTFNVGAGQLSHEKRRAMWIVRDSLPGMWCKVGYQNITAKRKVPRCGLCIEVSVTKESGDE